MKKQSGHKVGTKRRDMRWIDEHGEVWASKFESLVYEAGKRANLKIKKCDKGGSDTVSYRSQILHGVCQSCQGTDISQERRYTPDLCVIQDPEEGSAGRPNKYYVEVKGYTRGPQRALLRSLCKAAPIADLRFVLQSDYKVTRSLTFGGWIDKYLKCKWAVWDGSTFPTKWNQNEKRTARQAIRKVS